MDESIERATSLLAQQGHALIYSTVVKATTIFKPSEMIAITDHKFFVLSPNGNKIKQTYSFLDLTEIKTDQNVISLNFGKNIYSFEANSPTDILSHLMDVIQHILSLPEQRNIQINGFKASQLKQNGSSAISRFKENNEQFSEQDFTTLQKILIYSQPYVSFLNFSYPTQFIKPFINILPFCPHIKSLSLPPIKGIDPYQSLSQLAKNSFMLKHISITGDITKSYHDFINSLNDNQDSNLFGLSFSYSNMESDALDTLQNFAINKKLHSLGFHRAIQEHAMNYFYSTFLSPKLFDSIYILNLSNTTHLNFQKLMPKIQKVAYLSLNNCGIEIHDILSNVKSFSKLKMLDLSHNRCSNPNLDAMNIDIPSSFNHLIVDNVSFSSNCLISFFKFIFDHFLHGIKLSIASIVAPNDEWTPLFDYFVNSSFKSFVSLNWDSNPINSKFFTFLLRSPYFESLSLNSCFKSSSSDSLVSLSLFVQSSQSLTTLSVRGCKHHYIGNNLSTLLKMVQSSESLRNLDITYAKCGDAGLNHIREFINSSPRLETFVFDGSKPEKADTLVNLLKSGSKLQGKLQISFPENDIEKLIKKGELSREQANSIRDLYRMNEKSKDSFYMKPFRVFRYFHKDSFPSYLSKKEIEILRRNEPLIRDVPSSVPNSRPTSTNRSPTGVQRNPPFENSNNGDVNENMFRKSQNEAKAATKPVSSTIRAFLKPDYRIAKPKSKDPRPIDAETKPKLHRHGDRSEKSDRTHKSGSSNPHSIQSRDIKLQIDTEDRKTKPRSNKIFEEDEDYDDGNDSNLKPKKTIRKVKKVKRGNHDDKNSNKNGHSNGSTKTHEKKRLAKRRTKKNHAIEEAIDETDQNSPSAPSTAQKAPKSSRRSQRTPMAPRPSSQLANYQRTSSRSPDPHNSSPQKRKPSPGDKRSVKSVEDSIDIHYKANIDWTFPELSHTYKINDFWRELRNQYRVDALIEV
ncbi:hypothetical protein TRFO_32345 [Tritrichomonas foetus]|uniref:Leucine Rich Repeat family protein n=1 Tax=Tritrichomonas foetus TaxID=1144522 RepID=A0A1J4JP18_9EUKA|nr:hypothetical protein TRFO_32345 [Tritrichomonas foetus]|eukprot:OHT00873.1 hypothetical protein TRFO_32345 [Tritrichomonas foetus]